MTTKRGYSLNGDLFTIALPGHDLTAPFTTFVDVSFHGITHQLFAAATSSAYSYSAVTGEFSVGDYQGHVLEQLDNVQTQVAHRYQALVQTPSGTLSVHSFEGVDHLLALVGAIGIEHTPLGVRCRPEPDVEFVSAPRVALQMAWGVLELTPLTAEVLEQLPTWQGTPAAHGDLYGGSFADDTPYLTLVTDTCRVIALPGAGADIDETTALLATLRADWKT